jgi:hypothetical protein
VSLKSQKRVNWAHAARFQRTLGSGCRGATGVFSASAEWHASCYIASGAAGLFCMGPLAMLACSCLPVTIR